MPKTITKSLILTSIFVVALSVSYVFAAWTGPTQAPPGGNTPTPIHVGATTQTKSGGIKAGALRSFTNLYVDGKAGIGTTNPRQTLQLDSLRGEEVGLRIHQNEVRWWDFKLKPNDPNLYLTDVSANADRMVVNTSGYVGVGTINPTQAMDVAGYVKGQSGLCIGDDCRTSWPGGGGSDNWVDVTSSTGSFNRSCEYRFKGNSGGYIGDYFYATLVQSNQIITAWHENEKLVVSSVNKAQASGSVGTISVNTYERCSS